MEVMQEKVHIKQLSSSWNTIGMINSEGGLIVHGSRNVVGPVCLGTITTPKEWVHPVQADNLLGYRLAKICAGPVHTCAITEEGLLITWGMNVNIFQDESRISGQLGHSTDVICPPAVMEMDWGKVLDVGCGVAHTIVLTEKGVYSFGSDTHSQSGRPGSTAEELLHPTTISPLAFASGMKVESITQISCGANHTVAIGREGSAYAWGDNSHGQCQQNRSMHSYVPIPLLMVSQGTRWSQAACGITHTLLLSEAGDVFSCGNNLFGQLGLGSVEHDAVVMLNKVRFQEKSTTVWKITAGGHASSAISTEGLLFQWGLLRSDNRRSNQPSPSLCNSLYDQHMYVTGVGEGTDHTVFTSNGKIMEAMVVLAKYCRFESAPNVKEVAEALQSIPPFLVSSVQLRVARWLHQKYTLRPYLQLSTTTVSFDILDTRNLTDTLITRHLSKVRTTAREYTSQLLRTLEIHNPMSKAMQVNVCIEGSQISEKLHNYQLLAVPSDLLIPKKGAATLTLMLQYSEKDPPPQQWLMFSITVAAKQKHANETPNANTVSRQFLLVRLKNILRVRGGSTPKRELLSNAPMPSAMDLLQSQLSPYLPHILLSKFHKNPQVPTEPYIEKFPAAILFVDISGFTSLNERLAALGPAGPERVSHHINSYFTSLIRAVNDHGGDTLKFAGDALICMFGSPYTSQSLEALTRSATQCALSIQTTLAKYDSNQGFTLTLHVGIGAGEIYALYVGGVQNTWEFLVTGEPLIQLRTCVDLSSTGEVVVSQQVWDLINPFFEGELIADSENRDWLVHRTLEDIPTCPLPTLTSLHPEFSKAARCFIPQAVQVQIDSRQTKWMDELRVVTVLFVKLNSPIPSSTMEEFCQSLQQYLVLMQAEVFRYAGMVRQFLADDKGTVLIAAFGLPPSSHMDGGLRGIRAAVAIHNNLKAVGMDNSIGITTGAVFCGAVGATNRREYAMVGDIVNLSARLMVAASKMDLSIQVLCDKATAEGCKGKIEMEELEPIYVKGKANPIDIYRPSAQKVTASVSDQSERRSTSNSLNRSCVGFEKEFDLITKQLKAVFSKQTPSLLFMLQGETGTGKSTILSRVVSGAKRLDFTVLLSTGDSIATTNPYYIWQPILHGLLTPFVKRNKLTTPRHGVKRKAFSDNHESPNSSKEQSLYQLACGLAGPQYDEEMYLLQQALPDLDLPPEQVELSDKSQLNANQKRLRLSQMITQMIRNKTKGHSPPLFISLDDLQWADPCSLQLLHHLLSNGERVFFLCCRRPMVGAQASSEIDKMLTLECSTALDLQPFGHDQIEELIRSLFRVNEVPEEIHQLVQPAQGNPMYCTEIIHHLLSTHAISVVDGVITISTDIGTLSLPPSLPFHSHSIHRTNPPSRYPPRDHCRAV